MVFGGPDGLLRLAQAGLQGTAAAAWRVAQRPPLPSLLILLQVSHSCQPAYTQAAAGMDRLRQKLHDTYKQAAEAVLPPRRESAFKEKGVRPPCPGARDGTCSDRSGGAQQGLSVRSLFPQTTTAWAAAAAYGALPPRLADAGRPCAAAMTTTPHPLLPQVLTPEEFVVAGDYLVNSCGTWAWEGGDPKKAWPFLPPGKQYLITRNGARGACVWEEGNHCVASSAVSVRAAWLQ